MIKGKCFLIKYKNIAAFEEHKDYLFKKNEIKYGTAIELMSWKGKPYVLVYVAYLGTIELDKSKLGCKSIKAKNTWSYNATEILTNVGKVRFRLKYAKDGKQEVIDKLDSDDSLKLSDSEIEKPKEPNEDRI